MNFKLTTEQETLKKEFEEFFCEEAKNAPKGWFWGSDQGYETDEGWAYNRSVAKKLGKKGWLALAWPKEYGGMGYGPIEQILFTEARAHYRVPGVDPYGPTLVAASIFEYGTAEQKNKWLPLIAKGEIDWCQGWSEPNAGSDLASLTTGAVKSGDDYLINGQKIWTTGAHRASHIFLLARTDFDAPKHKGITYFITETTNPGIDIRPIYYMSGERSYNETFLKDVKIPTDNVLGPVNHGWYVTMTGIAFERTVTIRRIIEAKRDLFELVQFCKENKRDGKYLYEDPNIRHKIAEIITGFEIARQWAYYVAWLQSKQRPVTAEASALRYYCNELLIRFVNLGMEILGLYGTLKHDSKWAKLSGKYEYLSQHCSVFTIGGGITETLKNIIAWLELKLPRD